MEEIAHKLWGRISGKKEARIASCKVIAKCFGWLLENSWEQLSQWIGTVPRCVRYMTYVLYPTVDSGIPCWSFLLDVRRPCLTWPQRCLLFHHILGINVKWTSWYFRKFFGIKPYPINCMVFSTIWCFLKIWDPPQSPKGWRWKLELWSSVMDDH